MPNYSTVSALFALLLSIQHSDLSGVSNTEYVHLHVCQNSNDSLGPLLISYEIYIHSFFDFDFDFDDELCCLVISFCLFCCCYFRF